MTHSELEFYLGMEIRRERNKGQIFLRQQQYIIMMGEKFRINEIPAKERAEYPMVQGFVSKFDESKPILGDNYPFRQLMGGLLYIARFTRPDIMVAVNILCKYMDKPQERQQRGY